MTRMGDTVAKALRDLGEDPAGSLARLGIKGYRGNARACPVARYLGGQFEGYEVIATGLACVLTAPEILVHHRALTPEPVRRFIDEFDQGRHPQLEINEPA